jgi:DNA-binding NarL/FixJ family response regulator
MIQILVVDDHTIFRSGLRKLLSDEIDMRVEDEARDVSEMLSKLRRASFHGSSTFRGAGRVMLRLVVLG